MKYVAINDVVYKVHNSVVDKINAMKNDYDRAYSEGKVDDLMAELWAYTEAVEKNYKPLFVLDVNYSDS